MNNELKIKTLRTHLERQKGQELQIQNTITQTNRTIKKNRRELRRYEQAREIIREVGLKTQQQLSFHISDITSLALEAVFIDPYKLIVEFVQRRNKTECDLYFDRDGNRVEPLQASGGGAVDVAAFALRIASWSMQRPKSRNVVILDEPFKHLKGVRENILVLDMVNEISKKLGIQIIMVSDERIDREEIVMRADKVFETRIKKGVTEVL